MQIAVKVQVAQGGEWQDGILTDERAESSYGLPVIVIEGEELARGSQEVCRLDASQAQDLLRRACEAGYRFLVR